MATYYLNHGRIAKTAGSLWFSEVYPTEARERIDSLKALNLANPWTKTVIDADAFEYKMYFATLADCQSFLSYSAAMPLSAAWHVYNNENDITETIIYRGYVDVDPAEMQAMRDSPTNMA